MATEYIKTIECPKCRYKNVAGTKFCGDCGTALGGSPIPCGTCGTENPSGTKFCGNCGSNLQNPQENDPDIRHLQDALRGKYIVQKPLGEGGFGRVFLAEHTGLGQSHVIKLLSADSSRSTDIRNRFFQEAQLIARLKHPNIVPIMDVAEYQGRPYYIMSYLNGGSLEDLLIKEKKLSTEKALEIAAKILSALSEVHSKGIIHRDLKPNNVLLDESGEPILIDFGIARVEEGSKAKTGTGFSIGTPVYMSPEQLDAKPISLTTDIYSMGIMLFELLTGKPPFEGSMSSLITQHNSAKLPSVSGKIDNSQLADGIQAVLQKACAKEPSARYGSAKEMRDAVLGLIQAKPKPNPEWEKMEAEHKRREEELRKKEEELQARERVVLQERRVEVVKASYVKNPTISSTYTNSLGMEFVLIPAGEFMMGAVPQDKEALVHEKPQHKVRITKPFYIGKYPVTQEEWKKVMGKNHYSYNMNDKIRIPVNGLGWNDCKEFILNISKIESKAYRLPTEAEWEFAARGGPAVSSSNLFLFTYGDDVRFLGEYAWYFYNSSRTYQSVGQKKPNPIGLYDIMGNVWEWCEDLYDKDFYKKSPESNPIGANRSTIERVLRGGSIFYDASACRISSRLYADYDHEFDSSGLRLVLVP